jgi:uncharacterized protein YjaG (DUF416 family)
MYWREYEAAIRKFADSAQAANAIAFAAACLERQAPIYREFCKRAKVPDFEPIRLCLDAIWNWLLQDEAANVSNLVQVLRDSAEPIDGGDDASYSTLMVIAGTESLVVALDRYSKRWADIVPGHAFGTAFPQIWLSFSLNFAGVASHRP